MEINVGLVKASYESLKSELSALENTELNLFSALANIYKFDWIDGNSIDFSKEIEQEKFETDLFQMYVSSLIRVYNYIHGLYESLGNKIKCNLDKKNIIISHINSNISLVESILNEYNRTDLDFPYGEFGTLRSCRNTYKEIKKKLINMKDYFEFLYNKIETLEANVAKKIKEIEEFMPRKYIFALFASKQKKKKKKCILLYNEFGGDLRKIDFHKKEENDINLKLYKQMKNMKASYISKNNGAYFAKIESYKKDFHELLLKRNEYLKTLNGVPPLYDKAAFDTIKIFEEV